MSKRHDRTLASALAFGTLVAMAVPGVQAWVSPEPHIFSINDIQGGFDGSTYGTAGAFQKTDILCGVGDGLAPPCQADDAQPFQDKEGVWLYPVDSEFGFYVVDFVGAQEKAYDQDYMEGWAGNIMEGGALIGIKISNAETDRYKVKAPLGTWCQGLGGNSVKCSTEHYTVMEHVLSCHETIPYFYADPVTGEQGIQSTPDGSLSVNCGMPGIDLDDDLAILVGGAPTVRLTDATPGVQMEPNDNTSVLDNIALGPDYSVTLKDDGKALYRWGGLIKRPNDIRLYARLAVPEEWKAPGADFKVTKAHLVVNHWITNNPNDQLRPEDLENEAATGRKPDYRVFEGGAVWKSTKPCYEGDADVIDDEEGTIDPTFIGVGTYFRNQAFAVTGAPSGAEPGADPYPFSGDLPDAHTNAFFTTIERDPFEWSYRVAGTDPDLYDFVGSAFPDDGLGELVSGPRWRLKANKFGQDIPGLEIPLEECSPPPFTKDNIKYNVGEPVTTVINLLDWEDDDGPLATSKGWVDLTVVADPAVPGRCMLASNPDVTIINVDGACSVAPGEPPITSNGLPMSNDFDLAVYVKGDRKSTAVYNAYLEIEYEGEAPEVPVCGAPTYSRSTENAVFLWNDCSDPQQWYMRVTGGGTTWTKYKGSVTSEYGFASLIGFQLELNDVVVPTPPFYNFFTPIDYSLIVGGVGQDGFNFRVSDSSGAWDGCFSGTTPALPILVGQTRVQVTAPFSLATFGACAP